MDAKKRYPLDEFAKTLSRETQQEVDAGTVRRICADGNFGLDGKVSRLEWIGYLAGQVVS